VNREEQFEINRGTWEYPCWEKAHWMRAADGPQFHWMRTDDTGEIVMKHESAMRKTHIKSTALEDEIRKVLAHGDLVPDAKKLIEAALEAQITGKLPKLDFLI
jgi:hypothetical protein